MNKRKSLWSWLLDIIEIYIPAGLFIILFICFLVGIFFRYVVKNPQSWSFELSTVAFLGSVILAGCLTDRYGEHISFDMVYDRRSEKTKTIMRIISNALVFVFLGLAVPASVRFIFRFNNLVTPIMKIPQSLVFCCFPILLVNLIIRSVVHMAIDIRNLVHPVPDTSCVSNDPEMTR